MPDKDDLAKAAEKKKDLPNQPDLKPVDMFDTAWPLLKSWTDLLTQPLRKDQALADSTFALWCRMLKELRGPEPLAAIKAELNVALTLTFPHTTIYKNFYQAMTGLMTGELRPNRELPALLDYARIELEGRKIETDAAVKPRKPVSRKRGK